MTLQKGLLFFILVYSPPTLRPNLRGGVLGTVWDLLTVQAAWHSIYSQSGVNCGKSLLQRTLTLLCCLSTFHFTGGFISMSQTWAVGCRLFSGSRFWQTTAESGSFQDSAETVLSLVSQPFIACCLGGKDSSILL